MIFKKTNYAKSSDSELCTMVAEKQSGAEKAFAELYSRHSQKVYAYCLRMTGDSNDSRDILQESFIRFYNSILEKKTFANATGYLLTITRNLCINRKRIHKTILNIEDFEIPSYDEGMENSEIMDVIARSLECLDSEYREAFVLRMYEGLSYEEMAEITGSSVSALKNRVWRAKEKVKAILTPYMEDLSK